MVFEWRGYIWDFSWCLMQSILVHANNRNNAGGVKPLWVSGKEVGGHSLDSGAVSVMDFLPRLFSSSLLLSISLSLFLMYTILQSQLQNIWPQTGISTTGDTLIYSFLSWFPISQGRNRFIHPGLGAHFWSSPLWLGVGCKEKFWAIQLGKGSVVTKACCTNACSYRKARSSSLTKPRHAHRAAGSSDLSSDWFWWLKVNI